MPQKKVRMAGGFRNFRDSAIFSAEIQVSIAISSIFAEKYTEQVWGDALHCGRNLDHGVSKSDAKNKRSPHGVMMKQR
jgi:hypothetical protein